MEWMSLKKFSKPKKIELLKALGYDSDGEFVLKDGQRYMDKYLEQPIRVENMIIVHKDILDCNPLSLTCWIEENGIEA
jgi:hypothetical protein